MRRAVTLLLLGVASTAMAFAPSTPRCLRVRPCGAVLFGPSAPLASSVVACVREPEADDSTARAAPLRAALDQLAYRTKCLGAVFFKMAGTAMRFVAYILCTLSISTDVVLPTIADAVARAAHMLTRLVCLPLWLVARAAGAVGGWLEASSVYVMERTRVLPPAGANAVTVDGAVMDPVAAMPLRALQGLTFSSENGRGAASSGNSDRDDPNHGGKLLARRQMLDRAAQANNRAGGSATRRSKATRRASVSPSPFKPQELESSVRARQRPMIHLAIAGSS